MTRRAWPLAIAGALLATGGMSGPVVRARSETGTVSIIGRVAAACTSAALTDLTVTLDGGQPVRVAADGTFRFDEVPDAAVAGLARGDHVLTASSPVAATKVARISTAGCAPLCEIAPLRIRPSGGSGCDGAGSDGSSIDAADPATGAVVDLDRDGVDDGVEDWLAERFAPVVHHGELETNYPVSVEWLLQRTSLGAIGERRTEGNAAPVGSQDALMRNTFADGSGQRCSSDGTRSVCKRSGYFLTDVVERDRRGQRDDPRGWISYVHSYPNSGGGITIQYWRAYAYDQSNVLLVDWGHGGDWEGIAVHLDRALRPATIGLLGHLGIERVAARTMSWDGTHPIVFVEEGGHASRKSHSEIRSPRTTAHQTWSGGSVRWFDGRESPGGGLVNLGEKEHPRNGQVFVRYSGLWGAPHRLFLTSGYWGPAFNETEAVCEDGRSAYRMSLGCGVRADCRRIFHTAWCDGIDRRLVDVATECVAASSVP